jgi:hypothetical protein
MVDVEYQALPSLEHPKTLHPKLERNLRDREEEQMIRIRVKDGMAASEMMAQK